jgi:hypothetical protein
MRRYQTELQEGVVGTGYGSSYIESYHRTGQRADNPRDKQSLVDYVEGIIESGFKPGSGDMYGRGLYSTGDWLSQFGGKGNGYMDDYGNAIIKYRTPAKGILIFDYRVAKKMYGGGYTLVDQAVKYGLFTASKMPRMIEVLSDDLEQSFKFPKVSADRAYWIWEMLWDVHKKYNYCIRNMISQKSGIPPMPYNLQQDYFSVSGADFVKDLYHNKKVLGIAFSGNHDGNVLFIKEDALGSVKPMQYCIMDWRRPGDSKAFILPWTLVGGNVSATGLQGAIKDFLAAAGIPKGTNTFDEVYIQDLFNIKETAAIQFVKDNFPWTSSMMNKFSGLDVAFGDNKRDYIIGGNWLRGTCNAHYFGTPNEVLTELQKIGRPSGVQSDDMPVFRSGDFDGDIFAGVMIGGVFKRGLFNGVFRGGLIDFDGKVTWGPKAKRVLEKSLTCSIRYGGKIYKIGDMSPDVFIANLKAGIQASQTGGIAGVDDAKSLSEAIKNKLSFKAINVIIQDNWRGAESIPLGFADFVKVYPWLFSLANRITWKDNPVFEIDNTKITLIRGELRTGSVYFDVWEKRTSMVGGNVYGKNNDFEGILKGGNYREGNFNGIYEKGILYLDDTVWGKNAVYAAKDKPVFVFQNKQVVLNGEMMLLPDKTGKTPKYNTIDQIISGIKTGEYFKDFLDLQQAIRNYKAGKGPKLNLLNPDSIRKNKRNVGITQADIDTDTDDWDDNDDSLQESRITKVAGTFEFNEAGVPSIANLHEKQDYSDTPINSFVSGFDESEIAYAKTKLAGLDEKVWEFDYLDDQEQEVLYNIFRDTYVKATGAAFDKEDFDWRASNWTFFGEPPNGTSNEPSVGGIAVRKQPSGLIKLVASFGNFRGVLRGFDELNSRESNASVWGFLTPELAKLITKHSKLYKIVPGLVVKALESMIKKLSNGEVKSVGLDGSVMMDTPAGVMKKQMIGNLNYFRWMIDSIEDPGNAGRIPVPQTVLMPILGLVKSAIGITD